MSLLNKIKKYYQEVEKAKQTPFFNAKNTPKQWIGKVGQEFKNRGVAEGIHGITNPVTMSPYIRPITEKVVSKVRMANYKSGRPFSALNAILGQQDSQMADKRRKKNLVGKVY